jgi:hypothetical protein
LEDGDHSREFRTILLFVKGEIMAFKVKTATVTVHPRHWKEFAKLAADQGQTASSLVRLLVAKELRRAAQEQAATLRAAKDAQK